MKKIIKEERFLTETRAFGETYSVIRTRLEYSDKTYSWMNSSGDFLDDRESKSLEENYLKLNDETIQTKYKQRTLLEVFDSKLEEANDLGLNRFVFDYKKRLYFTEFKKGIWNDPALINKM